MAEMGTYIIQGLLEGLNSLIENVIQFFVDLKREDCNETNRVKRKRCK